MTSTTVTPTPGTATRRRTGLWILQIVVGVFFLVAAGGPKLFGEATAVQMFTDIGVGDWLRYVVGTAEVAGAIGLFVPRLAGLAALGLTVLMVGAVATQLLVLGFPVLAITPAVLGILVATIAWARRTEIAALFGR